MTTRPAASSVMGSGDEVEVAPLLQPLSHGKQEQDGHDSSPLAQSILLAVDAIRAANTIVTACHVNPDGDALGSMLGLALGLAVMGKSLTILSADGVPDIYRFLPGVDAVRTSTNIPGFDLAIVLDSGDLSRVGATVVPAIRRARRLIDIDHHTTGAFGDIQVLAATSASTAEIVYELLIALDLEITADIATCLFTGIITDTGSFRFHNVTPGTFRIAAHLIEDGAPPATISENVFDNRSLAATQILGAALSSLGHSADGRIVWATITNDDFVRFHATDEDTEGVVNFARYVRGAHVGVLFREMPDGSARISLRSRESVNVGVIAQEFGGGGHRMAAGCTMPAPLAEAQRKIIDAVERGMD
jgi:bifunctional oligoribonuclease and PAP phosphatase NrnA